MKQRPSYELSQVEVAHIARYLQGEFEKADREAFEARLESEPELRLKVEEVKALIIGVREASLAQELEVFHEAVANGATELTKPRRMPFYRQWWVAVAAAIIVTIGVWQVWFASPRHERLYWAYFVPDVGLPIEMGSADTIRYVFYDGMISYKEGNYADALVKWDAVAKAGGISDTLRYYVGLAHMGLNDLDAALEPLAAVANERRSAFYEEATWYLALCYLRQGENRTASSLLKRIADDEQAAGLLKKLE